jgi:nucleoside-diphosphate kinase
MERTVAIIKPHVVAAGNGEKVVEAIEHHGFYVNRRKELTISRDSASTLFADKQGSPEFHTLIDSVSSGASIVLLLSKLDAVRSLNGLAGPNNVRVAKSQNPSCLRAQFGDETSPGANVVEASANVPAAELAAEHFFPAGPTSTMPAREYLLETVMPGLVEALTDMCLIKPADPYSWLQNWLQANRPRTGTTQYPSPVLSGHVVCADQYEGIHSIADDQPVDSVWNMRRAQNSSAIFGMGQCTVPGLNYVAKSLYNEGFSNIVWACLRDEPVLYLNEEPVGLRAEDAVQDRAGYFPRDARKLSAMEARLKRDVFASAGVNRGELGVYHNAGKAHELQQVQVQKLTTVDEAFGALAADAAAREAANLNYPPPHPRLELNTRVTCRYGNTSNLMEATVEDVAEDGTYQMRFTDGETQNRTESDIQWPQPPPPPERMAQVELWRIPITDETEPTPADFDLLAAMLNKVSFGSGTALVMSCHTGTERASTAMVVATMLYHVQHGWQQSSMCFIDSNRPNLSNGEFPSVLALLQLVDNGLELKALVDAAISECASSLLQSLEKTPCRTLLMRYCYLILFAAFVRSNNGSLGSSTFEQWLAPQLSIQRLLARIEKS